MIPRAISVALVAPALAGAALLFTAGAAFAAPQNFTASLSSANEVGGGAGLTGTATVTVDPSSGQVCAKVTSNVTGAVAMHIHKGASGANGPVVVPLDVKSINGASICVGQRRARHRDRGRPGRVLRQHPHSGEACRGTAGPAGLRDTHRCQRRVRRPGRDDPGTNVALVALMVAGAGLTGAAGWRLVRR